jgi:undecaprenyl-diphosphatase
MLGIALLLGLVEGLTEFLPVSSTGHLILVGHWVGYTGEKADTFEVFIQFGAILAVLLVFFRRFLGLWPRKNQTGFAGWQALWLLFLATLPAVILGKLFHGTIKEHLFNPLTVSIGLALGGIFILVVEKWQPKKRFDGVDSLNARAAFMIGCFQCLALWPGMSRASSTILGGMILGLERKQAAEFSFLAAVPLIFGATAYDLYKSWHLLSVADLPFFATGFVMAFFTAWAAIRFFLGYLASHTLSVFGWYRLGIALLAAWYFW